MLATAGSLTAVDWVVLASYFAVMLVIGVYFYRFMRHMRDYFSGGNRIPWWLSGGSFYMSTFSVFGFIVYSALAYEYGWLAVTIFWSYIPGTLLCTLVFAKRWRRARIDSPIEYLETRYSPTMRQVCAWHGIPVKIIDDALKLVAIGVFFKASLGLGITESILWSGLIMLAYTFMGGLWAVVVTDFVQFVVMGCAVILLFVLALIRTGGIGGFVDNAPEGTFDFVVQGDYGWVYIVSMVFLYAVSMSSVHWQLIQRFCCVPNEREIKKMGFMVIVLQFITPVLMFVPAMAARQFLGGDVVPREIYPTLCVSLLPAGLLGLMIAAMFAATMSMLSSDYNVCANVITNDVYRRLIRPQATQKELVLVGRVATVSVGLISLAVAFLMIELGGQDLFRSMVKLFSVATAPVAVPMVLGLISRKLSAAGALAGFAAGLILGIVLFAILPGEVNVLGLVIKTENLLLFSTAIVSGVVMVVVSKMLPQSEKEVKRSSLFYARLASAVGQMEEDETGAGGNGSSAFSPFSIVGISVVLIGLIMLAVSPFVAGRVETLLNAGIGAGLTLGGGLTFLAARRSAAKTSNIQ